MIYDNQTTSELKGLVETLLDSSFEYFGQNMKHVLDLLEHNQPLHYILLEVCSQYKFDEVQIDAMEDSIDSGKSEFFANQAEHVSFCYNWLLQRIAKYSYNFHHHGGYDWDQRKRRLVNHFIIPIVNYLTFRLKKANSLLYLMERYKRRTEWFTKELLLNQYYSGGINYEEIFEMDLRLFLFDQGINYPLSSPKLQKARADIVSQLDSEEPILIEIKFCHKERQYGKERIVQGFRQIEEYVRSYRKNFGFLVVYNLDSTEIVFDFENSIEVGLPSLTIEGRTYYFLIVNLAENKIPSRGDRKGEIIVKAQDLLK